MRRTRRRRPLTLRVAGVSWSILPWLFLCLEATARQPAFPLFPTKMAPWPSTVFADASRRRPSIPIVPRGGSDDEADGESHDEMESAIEFEFELPTTSLRRSVRALSTTLLHRIYPYYVSIVIRMRRTWTAGWDAARTNPDDSIITVGDGEDFADSDGSLPKLHSLLGKTAYVFQKVCRAAVQGDDDGDGDDDRVEQQVVSENKNNKIKSTGAKPQRRRRRHKGKSPTAIVSSGGGIDHSDENAITSLAKKYDLDVDMTQKHHSSIFTTPTSLQEALQKANADARFLICYISSSDSSDNRIVIPTLLHPQFTKLIQRKPLGKKNIQDTGSFYLWICTEQSERESAIKRLKLKPKQSILTIIHPAATIDSSSHRLRVSPRILVMHHANPPPSNVQSMMAWVTSVRKRHYKEYAKLQHDRKERMLLQERNEGYKRSMEEDSMRERKEKEELQKKREEEEELAKRREEMERRRVQLLENLASEPENGEGVITIALRFQSLTSNNATASMQRRFSHNDTMNNVFNWIDAVHCLEREGIVLSTMNGSRTFFYVEEKGGGDDCGSDDGGDEERGDNLSLEEAGLGRMTALRVAAIAQDGGASRLDQDLQ